MFSTAPIYFTKYKHKGSIFYKSLPSSARLEAIAIEPKGGFIVYHPLFAAYMGKFATHSVAKVTSEYITFRVVRYFEESEIEMCVKLVDVNDFAKPNAKMRAFAMDYEFYLDVYLDNSKMCIYNHYNDGLWLKA